LEAIPLACPKKKAIREGRTIVFVDESGLSERPHVARTWAPRGQTPILQFHFNWKKLSVIAGITWWRFYFRLYPGAVRAAEVVDFLGHLLRQLPGPLLVIWDGLPVHRSQRVRAFVDRVDSRLILARLPAYAPELNPTEYIWGHWKCHMVANFCPADYAELTQTARRTLRQSQRRTTLVRSFWKQSELSL
jgi:transposase